MGFKENLRDEIAYQGLMVKELAGRAGLNPGTISNYLRENSSVPSADIAVKLAKALHVSVEYLVTGADGCTFTPEVRLLAEKLALMAPRDRKLVAALINAISAESA